MLSSSPGNGTTRRVDCALASGPDASRCERSRLRSRVRARAEPQWRVLAETHVRERGRGVQGAALIPKTSERGSRRWDTEGAFPPVGDQCRTNSCVAWATTYYGLTYQV